MKCHSEIVILISGNRARSSYVFGVISTIFWLECEPLPGAGSCPVLQQPRHWQGIDLTVVTLYDKVKVKVRV